MQLSVSRHAYSGSEAAVLAYSRKSQLMRHIRDILALRRIDVPYGHDGLEDILQDGIALLLSAQYDCANAEEAINEAVAEAIRLYVRDITKVKTVSESFTYSDSKNGDSELSRFDYHCPTDSTEDILLAQEAECSLQEAIERAEAARYAYGFDVLLALLLHAGVSKGLWKASTVNGLLVAFDSAIPLKKYIGEESVSRVVQAAVNAEPEELVEAMRANLSRCDVLLSALGYKF